MTDIKIKLDGQSTAPAPTTYRYTVTGAPPVPTWTNPARKLRPVSAHITFCDGVLTDIHIRGPIMTNSDGTLNSDGITTARRISAHETPDALDAMGLGWLVPLRTEPINSLRVELESLRGDGSPKAFERRMTIIEQLALGPAGQTVSARLLS